jgi:hypothetical protein
LNLCLQQILFYPRVGWRRVYWKINFVEEVIKLPGGRYW